MPCVQNTANDASPGAWVTHAVAVVAVGGSVDHQRTVLQGVLLGPAYTLPDGKNVHSINLQDKTGMSINLTTKYSQGFYVYFIFLKLNYMYLAIDFII